MSAMDSTGDPWCPVHGQALCLCVAKINCASWFCVEHQQWNCACWLKKSTWHCEMPPSYVYPGIPVDATEVNLNEVEQLKKRIEKLEREVKKLKGKKS